MAKETYVAAKARLFSEFRKSGYVVKDKLKVPQVIISSADTLFFRAQAVYLNDHSTFLDIRGMSLETLMGKLYRHYPMREKGV